MAARGYGQYCGVATAVELIGERWALLIVRDLLVGPRRYTDLKAGLPRIPTNILSTRLKDLQAGGVVRRVPIARCGLVYELTPYGRELEPIVVALGRWGFTRMGDPREGDVVTPDSLTIALRTAFQVGVAASMPDTAYELHVGDIVLRADVRRGELAVAQLAPALPPVGGRPPEGDPDVVLAAGPAIRSVISGELSPADAVEQGLAHVLQGDPALFERFARVFHIDPGPAEIAA
ncbi:winged helix-turn-helix transcriptional regulator [Microbacterium gilvum]|uniref:Winged helix-turn-helix transcriptional regulator n=1 Tax=Microbacterium gilvum TaxID=1336204 RepID=A0ABP9A3F0_9MICO